MNEWEEKWVKPLDGSYGYQNFSSFNINDRMSISVEVKK